ncbi:hypothetical protein DSM104299_05377 [Baekduia alba]|uniref:hypothetical protein n=1 Tax=Baekduia alba TaxID=2997333 RepID=UPI0023406033|nr:hypothetical protein [Baekduia alba]WCB96612.1 hypothetical protein DSM104299_05377 [Baekduia alba]
MLFEQPPSPPPPGPPPLAFRSATLDRAAHTVDVELMASAQISASVVVARHGVRLGHGSGAMDRGGTVISVKIGPKGIKPLRKGLHVDVLIYWGAGSPLRAHPALKLAPPDPDGPLAS